MDEPADRDTVRPRDRTFRRWTSAIIVVVLVGVLVVCPIFLKAREKLRSVVCYRNLAQLQVVVHMYAADHDERLPLKHNWCDVAAPYTSNDLVFQCPSLPGERNGYGYNARLSGLPVKDVLDPSETPMLFDATGGWNVSGGPEIADPRHGGGLRMAFVDGVVRWREVQDLRLTAQPATANTDTEASGDEGRRE